MDDGINYLFEKVGVSQSENSERSGLRGGRGSSARGCRHIAESRFFVARSADRAVRRLGVSSLWRYLPMFRRCGFPLPRGNIRGHRVADRHGASVLRTAIVK